MTHLRLAVALTCIAFISIAALGWWTGPGSDTAPLWAWAPILAAAAGSVAALSVAALKQAGERDRADIRAAAERKRDPAHPNVR